MVVCNTDLFECVQSI